MCGIAGLFNPVAPLAFAPGTAAHMCALIEHRGPDDYGEFVDRHAQIGMRRLSIIDLAGGRQPIANEDGTVHVVFNGEIYNFKALRAELEGLGHRFATASDTECIVHAYEAFGTGCFAKLRGMFAIAILDTAQRRLVLARDRLGKKPLYYTTLADGTLAFASELKCLFAVPGFEPALARESVADFFTFGYVPGPASIFERVLKLPPAHYLQWQRGGAMPQRYWHLAFGPKARCSSQADADGLQQQLLHEIEDAVRVRLVSDVPFGAFLSGGIDSSIVSALMARNLGSPLKTFSIGFNEQAFSELADARRVARHIGAEHHELVVDANAVRLIDRIVWHCDEPMADSSAIPTLLVAELASRHVKMVLSGDGGDELFAGYERYRKYLQLERLDGASGGFAAAALQAASKFSNGALAVRGRRIAERLAMPYPDRYLSGVALAREADLAALLAPAWRPPDPYRRVRMHFDAGGARDTGRLEQILAGDMATYLVDDILVKVDRMTMACSLEARVPLLDHQVVEFAARLPLSLKIRGGTGKVLLKQIARDLLPAEVIAKRKQGFAVPMAGWLRGALREQLLDTIHDPRFRHRPMFNHAGVQQCAADHLSGARDCSELLWSVLVFERWARSFVDRRPAVPAPGRMALC